MFEVFPYVGNSTMSTLISGAEWTNRLSSRLLARHQNVLARLRSEIDSVVGLGHSARRPNRNDLKKMPYLAVVIKEGRSPLILLAMLAGNVLMNRTLVLRLYPSVPVNSRAAKRTTVLPTGGGPDSKSPVLVREGEAVGYCVYAMHRRKELYGDDAESYRPERWEENDGNLAREIGYGYLPFNGGPRVCLGRK